MPIQSNWYVPKAVVFSRFSGAPTEDEIIQNGYNIIDLIETCDTPLIHIIVDTTAVTASPPLPATIRAAKSSPKHERAGWLVTIGEQNPIIKFASSVSRQLLQVRTQNFDTLEEAIAFLKSVDETIDWSQARAELLTSGPR